ncbi:MAG: polysaccharide pyruvyl transferase family protein [Methylococcales bacterium]|nr:polysaccharide pyruvyl transferase family protein [Methylococcales bacterium]
MTIIKDEVFDSLNPNIQGFVDNCDYQVVTGWLIDFSNVNRYLSLKVLIDGVEVCRGLADEYRQDLAENIAFNNTSHAYSIKIPKHFLDGNDHELNIVEVETNYVLGGSPLKINFPKVNIRSQETRMDLALVGKDGWLFLCNDSNNAIGQYTGEVKISTTILENYKSHYQAIQAFYRSKNICYLLTIVPGKESLYSEFLPNTVVASRDLSVKDKFIATINTELDTNILDLYPLLITNKSLGQLCYKNDSHWNYLGAMIASKHIINKLHEKFPNIPIFDEKKFTLINADEGQCDLNEKIRLNYVGGQFIENDELMENNLAVCAVGVQYDNNAIEILEHPYKMLSKTRPTRLFKHNKTSKLPRAIIVRDSYADWMIPFLTEYFSECLFIWARNVDNAVVESFKPDIIIEQVVDRFLAQNRLNTRKILTPVLYGVSSFIPNTPFLNADELSVAVGGNTGNLLYCHALSCITNTFNTIPLNSPLSSLSLEKHRLVLPLANALGSHIDLADLAIEFKDISIPMVGVGLGAQGEITGIDVHSIPDGSWEWLRVLQNKSATDYPNISLRGQMTYDAIASKGLEEKCVITGCPSNFINPSYHLGKEIFRRRANGVRRVAIVSGNPNLPLLNKLEQSLVKLVEDTNGLYVCQHPIQMLRLSHQEYKHISKSDLLFYKKYIHPTLRDDAFFHWFRRWSYVFTSVPEWLSTMKRFDLVVGTRIHGVMAGIQAGVPSVCLCIDSRTLELCETMMIPHVSAFDYLNGITLEEIDFIFSQWDWNAFDDNRQILARRFAEFFNENQLEVFGACKSLIECKK